MNDLTNGNPDEGKPMTAAQSLKNELSKVLPSLPKDWRDQVKATNKFYESVKGNNRLNNLRDGNAAPTLEELALLKKIAGVT